MQGRITLRLFVVIQALLLGAFALLEAAASQDDAQKAEPKTVAQKCLVCHGDYDKLADKTAAFKTSKGETGTPHRYVPHEDKKDIPECTECHLIQHSIPLTDKSEVVKAGNVDWCYSSCHHASTLQPCKACH